MTTLRSAAAALLHAIGLPRIAAYIQGGGGGGPRIKV